MNVVIVGAGTVGYSIAADLASAHDVVVVDVDPDRVDEISYSLDVLGVRGDGTSPETLEAAGVPDADIFIASTDDDKANVIAALVTKSIADVFTIVRVKRVGLLDTWNRNRDAFGVDHMICTDLQTAQVITDVIGLPAAQDVRSFAGGSIQMAEFTISTESPLVGRTVEEADRFDELTFVAVFRDERFEIVRGETCLRAGDSVVVIGPPERVRECSLSVAGNGLPEEAFVVIMGGSDIGYHTARQLEARGFKPRLIVSDADRATELATLLPETVVLQHDALDIEFLEQEKVNHADVVVAAFDSDEKNLLCSLLVARLGSGRTISVTENVTYEPLFEAVGVSAAVTPRHVAAEEIIRFTWEDSTMNVAIVEHDAAEVIEVVVNETSELVDRSIVDAISDLPNGVVVGAVMRNGTVIKPRGDTIIRPKDHVILFVEAAAVDEVDARI